MLADEAAKEALTPEAIRHIVLSWIALAVVGGIAAVSLQFAGARLRGPLFPPQRQRAVPWRFAEIGLLAILCLGWDFVLQLSLGVRPLEGLHGQERLEQIRLTLLATFLARPLQIVTILWVLRSFGAEPYQAGLTARRWRQDIIASYLLWLIVTALSFTLYGLVLQYEAAQKHPIQELLESGAGTFTWSVFVLGALILAPAFEELFVRGIVQPWMVRFPQAADLGLVISLIWAVVLGVSEGGGRPLLFLGIVGPGYIAFEFFSRRWIPRRGAARAIYASSLFFAAMHAGVWPTPIPLFVLSLGLGFLAYRTQSILGPIVAHGLFNAVSALMLIFQEMAKS